MLPYVQTSVSCNLASLGTDSSDAVVVWGHLPEEAPRAPERLIQPMPYCVYLRCFWKLRYPD